MPLKLSAEIAADIRARVKSLDFGAIEKISKAKDQNGTFDVIISTEVKDRAGEIVRQDGWDLTNYKNNPIVLWGHDYYSLPIGVCTETYNTTYRGVPALGARGVFYPADVNPLAQQVRRMYEYGVKSGFNVGCTTSVGFIPKEFDANDNAVITRAELLEFSFVPVPANQGVGPAMGRSLSFAEARELGIDVLGLKQKGVSFADTVGFVPHETVDTKAAENEAWTAPTLKDFTDKGWDELSDIEKRDIAAHFAWCADADPKTFDDLKLPYRRAQDGAVVLNGLLAAMRALTDDVTIEGDRKAVYDHLAVHYKLFGKDAPEFASLKAAEAGDDCTMDDGTPGVLADNGSGALVCQPEETKTADEGHASEKALLKAVRDEHERHNAEMEKAIDALCATEDLKASLKDMREAVRDEHTMHRAKSVAVFRAFGTSDDKAFDKKAHLKALRDEHDAYEAKNDALIDQLEERLAKKDASDDLGDWLTAKMDANEAAHAKAIRKLGKAMCKDAFGEEDEADEKVLSILSEHLSAYVPEPLQRAVYQKVGARISAATKEKLGEAHQHMKAATAIVEALHGALGNDDGEESRSDGDEKSTPAPAPAKKRSRPSEAAPADDALTSHLFAREVLRDITTAAQRGLEQINKRAKQ